MEDAGYRMKRPTQGVPPGALLTTAFVAGLVSLALELTAARLLAPAFGTTELVWATVIGLILLYLSAGYAIGGRWADRSPTPATLYTLLAAAGLTIAVIPIAARPLLLLAARGMQTWQLGLIAGPFAVVLVLFAAPVTLLACVSPFIVRLSVEDVGSSGDVVGRITALSTLGSFIGTFLPNLLLIPALGTRRTFLLLALLTLITGLCGLARAHRRRFWALAWTILPIGALFLWNPGAVKPVSGLIYEEESTYNLIQVTEDATGRRALLLNEGQGIHSIYTPPALYRGPGTDPLTLLTGGPWDFYLIAPYFNPPPYPPGNLRCVLVIGLAAGTTPTQLTEVYGPISIDGVEIDPAIVQVGRRYFEMTMPNLNVHIADGRTFLLQTRTHYDLVVVDAYRLPYIPWHLTTVEFFKDVRSHLTDDGVVAINVGHTPDDWRLVDAMVATMSRVYSSVHIVAVPNTFNAIVIATAQPSTPADFAVNLSGLTDPRLQAVGIQALSHLRKPKPSGIVFTDDRAPVEQLTDVLALRYVLGFSGDGTE